MKRNINLSESSQVLLNGLIDLKQITETLYSEVRKLYSPEDSVADGVGDDLLIASNNLSDVIEEYIRRGIQDSLSNPSTCQAGSVIL